MTPMSLMEVFAVHAATDVAWRSGLLDHLARTPSTAAEAADALTLDAGGVALVLEVLRAFGLLDDDGDGYRLAPAARTELFGPGGDVASNALVWQGTEALVREGRTLSSGEAEDRGPLYAGMVDRLGAMLEGLAAEFGRHFAPSLPEGARILDVGTGAGVWSLALLSERPDASATGLDLDPVVPRFLEQARARGLEARVDAIRGDYHAVPLPAGAYDLVILANVLHLEPSERAPHLLARAGEATAPGGRLVVVDVFPGHDPVARRRHAAYALHLGLRQPGARPHGEAEVRDWLAGIGFGRITRTPLDQEPALAAALAAVRPDTPPAGGLPAESRKDET